MESLARKYRPQTFEDVAGQESAITILRNQIAQNSHKQGYLFTGGAGTGKTTIARIFARELNGIDIKSKNKADIIEIDAASNNGVDNVRELREKVKYKPLNGTYKVYIIDEVHMLSTGAFNALLKTLEEPPKHAVFILCTTDPQKIPATILSRIQRFNFQRIPKETIISRLQHIIQLENEEREANYYQISDSVYDYISKLADGGMRDSISLLDTCIGYKSTLELDDVFEILGAAPITDYLNLLYYMYDDDKEGVIRKTEELHLKGKDFKQVVKGLLAFTVDIRKLVLFRSLDYVQVPEIYEESMKKIVNHINHVQPIDEAMQELFVELSSLANEIKYEQFPKVLVQGRFLTLCKS